MMSKKSKIKFAVFAADMAPAVLLLATFVITWSAA